MATIPVRDGDGNTVAIERPLAPGRAAAGASRPVALSNEDLAALGSTSETAPASDTAAAGLNGRLQRIAQLLSSLISRFPTALTGTGNFRVSLQEQAMAITTRAALPAASNLSEAIIGFSTSGDQPVVSATSSQTTRVHRLFLVAAGATTITFKSASTGLTGAITLTAGGSIVLDVSSEPWFTTGANEAFIINSSAAVQISGRLYYQKS